MHAKCFKCRCVVGDEFGIFARIHTGVECRRVEFQVGGKFFQLVLAKPALVFSRLTSKQLVVILPKRILIIRALARFRRPTRLWTQERELRVTESDDPRLNVLAIDLTQRVSGEFRAVRSLKIGELDDRNGRLVAPFEMSGLRHYGLDEQFLLRRFVNDERSSNESDGYTNDQQRDIDDNTGD